jgi:hypothetical protein
MLAKATTKELAVISPWNYQQTEEEIHVLFSNNITTIKELEINKIRISLDTI